MSEISVFVRAPAAAVFAYLADPRHRPEWQSSLRSVQMLDEGDPRVGMRWRDITAVPGVRPHMEITECTPYRLWAERGTWGGISADLSMQFVQTTLGTKVTATFDLSAAGPWLFAAAVAKRLAPSALTADLRKAAKLIEDHQ